MNPTLGMTARTSERRPAEFITCTSCSHRQGKKKSIKKNQINRNQSTRRLVEDGMST